MFLKLFMFVNGELVGVLRYVNGVFREVLFVSVWCALKVIAFCKWYFIL